MGFIFSLIPLNAIPIALIFAKLHGWIPSEILTINNYMFAILMCGLLMLTLSIEMIKSAMFAPTGSAAWVDFITSSLLLIAIFGYVIKFKGTVPALYWIALEAQFLDVMVGFYIAISNARRDFNTGG